MSKMNRILFGGIIAWLAGFSFTVAILPFLLELLAQVVPIVLNPMRQYLTPLTMAWIPVGMLAANAGTARQGAIILGIGGALLGGVAGTLAAGSLAQWWLVAVSALAAGVYGAGAGLLMGGGFAANRSQPGNGHGS